MPYGYHKITPQSEGLKQSSYSIYKNQKSLSTNHRWNIEVSDCPVSHILILVGIRKRTLKFHRMI